MDEWELEARINEMKERFKKGKKIKASISENSPIEKEIINFQRQQESEMDLLMEFFKKEQWGMEYPKPETF